MAVHPSAPPIATSTTPGSVASVHQGPNVLRKRPSLAVSRRNPNITRRHSWTASRIPRSKGPWSLDTRAMESGTLRAPSTSHGIPQMTDSLLSNKRSFPTTRPGATFEMAYYLRHTRPPATATFDPVRDVAQEKSRRAGRKKSRSGLFRKRRESPDMEIPTSVEEQKPPIFVPPEGVEQKVTARGNKYLQIVPHPDLIDLGRVYANQPYSVAKSEHAEAVSSEALDTWISSLSLHHGDSVRFDVKAPNFSTISMEAHENGESLPSSRPKTPLSFVSEARSRLPTSRDGFGLSIVDGPTARPYFNGPCGANEALCSNPPSDPATPPRAMHAHNSSIETAETPLLDVQRLEPVDSETIGGLPEYSLFDIAGEKERFERRSNGVLAGQGLRRPGRVEPVHIQTESSTPEIYPAAAVQARRNREAKVRARKIRELQRASKAINDMARDNAQRLEQSALIDELDDVFDVGRPQVKTPPRVTIPRHQNRLTKTMVVAEQVPLPRGRPLRKPARLVLRERSKSQDRSAVRTDEDLKGSPISPTTKPCTPPPMAPDIPIKSSTRNTPTTATAFTPTSYGKNHSTPLLPMTTMTPQAVTATASLAGGVRASLCSSSHTSTSREARLEARLEAVERENRLLEAALMAVLKTSGTLNRCPCVLLKERTDVTSEQAPSLKPAALIPAVVGSRMTTPLPVPPKGLPGSELQRVSEEGTRVVRTSSSGSSIHTRKGSWDSNGSGISALEVYLRTKIGA